jgi:hypothetical protein
MHPEHWGYADGQMHVGAALLRPKLQKRVNARQGDHPLLAGITELFCPVRAGESTSRAKKFDVTHGNSMRSRQKPRFLPADHFDVC